MERVSYSPVIRGAHDGLADDVVKKGRIVMWMRSLEDQLLSGPEVLPSPITPMICLSGSRRLRDTVCRVTIFIGYNIAICEMANSISIKCPVSDLLETIGRVNRYLWFLGCEIISYSGDLMSITRDPNHEVSMMFSVNESVHTPCLWFLSDDHSEIAEFMSCLIIQEPKEADATFRDSEIIVHTDWRQGTARLAASFESNMTMKSLAAWRSVQAVEVRELTFDRDSVACEAQSPEEICEVQPGNFWLGEVISAADAGYCSSDSELLVSSYHVTYGYPVTLTRAGLTYT